jgi:hypothetical protein
VCIDDTKFFDNKLTSTAKATATIAATTTIFLVDFLFLRGKDNELYAQPDGQPWGHFW